MLRELLALLRGTQMGPIGGEFGQMLHLSHKAIIKAGKIYFSQDIEQEKRDKLHERDKRVNKLERKIRKRVLTYLAVYNNTPNLPYCLVLMSLVKDVERIGDYAKNLTEVGEFCPRALPKSPLVDELKDIRAGVESGLAAVADVFETSDKDRALALIREGTHLAKRCDSLLERIAGSDHSAETTTALVLGTRYYKRIGGHVLNVLSSIVQPLHKIDYVYQDETRQTGIGAVPTGTGRKAGTGSGE